MAPDARPVSPPGTGPVTPDEVTQAISEHVAALRRYARALVRNRDDAEDLVQETLVRILARTARPCRIDKLRAYLFATLHNACRDRERQRRNAGQPVSLDGEAEMPMVPARQLQWVELSQLVAAVHRLPADQRQVLLLVAVEGFSYAEVADMIQVPIGTVMSRLARARTSLRCARDPSRETPDRDVPEREAHIVQLRRARS